MKIQKCRKITSFSDAVTLTFDLRPWKVNQVRTLSLPMCIQIWEQSIPWFFSYRVNTIAGGGWLRRKTITSPDPSDTGDIIISMNCSVVNCYVCHYTANKAAIYRRVMFTCLKDDNVVFCFYYVSWFDLSSNWNIFRVTCHLWGEFTGHWWITPTKASDTELWYFLWSAPE